MRKTVVMLGLAATAMAAPAAEAGIRCTRDGYQVVQGNQLATPYCQDNLLGRVAREYGMRVSDAAVRGNPNLKREVCRLVGRDIRVQHNCVGENSDRRR